MSNSWKLSPHTIRPCLQNIRTEIMWSIHTVITSQCLQISVDVGLATVTSIQSQRPDIRISNVSEYVDTSTLKAMINGKTKEQSEQDVLKFASTVAKLGSLFHTEKEDQNNWKKRMLNTVDGVSFPDDWDSLSEDEKEKRLNKAIEIND